MIINIELKVAPDYKGVEGIAVYPLVFTIKKIKHYVLSNCNMLNKLHDMIHQNHHQTYHLQQWDACHTYNFVIL